MRRRQSVLIENAPGSIDVATDETPIALRDQVGLTPISRSCSTPARSRLIRGSTC